MKPQTGCLPRCETASADVPWREPIRLRNRVVHGYWSIDVEIVHTTAQDHLPLLVGQLRAVLTELATVDDPGDAGPSG